MEKILLVEDDARELRAIATFLKYRGYKVLTAADGKEAERLVHQVPDVIVTDLKLAGMTDGLEVLRSARNALPETPVIITTGHGTVATAVEAMKQGAFDYLAKPVDPEELVLTIRRAAERSQLWREVRRLRQQLEDRGGLFGMIGNSGPMRRVYEQVQLVAPTRSTVLITGESGTGKELVARAIHQLSTRKDGPFVALNCAAIPKDLAESELFGHTKGAFTGAADRRVGTFAAADGGTLLIDEIGEMDLPIQAKLLRTLETRTVNPIGSNSDQPIDVRVVAATHRDLRTWAAEGKFREDLYYRLNVIHIELPPLRERREDLPVLVATFLQQFNTEHGRNVEEITLGAMDAFQCYRWPGNVRELRNVVEGLVVLSRKDVIELEDLPGYIRGNKECGESVPPQYRPGVTLVELERDAIQQCLIHTGGRREQAAKLLGISARTLIRKIQEYQLIDPLRAKSGASRQATSPE